jgi:DNA replication initiation complex subunit (GINS family)
MDAEDITYRKLRKIQQMEKNSPTLTRVDPGFYNVLSGYLKHLDDRLEQESSAQKKMLLMDEIQNTHKIAMSIYELREKKILLTAMSKVRGGNPDLRNLLDPEKNLFESTLDLMRQIRQQIFNIESNDEQEETTEVARSRSRKERENTNPVVRVTEDIPEFVGTDTKCYNLRKGDVLSLPSDMNQALTKRGVVEQIKVE